MKTTYLPFYLCKFFYVAAILLFSQTGFSQYIYIENFNTDDNKGWIYNTSDFGGVDWTMDVTGGSLTASSDWFSVKNDMLEARDVDGEVYWYSPELEISAYTDVAIQIDLSESGNHESSDHIYCWYSLDGGAYVLFDSQVDDFNSATASIMGLSGSTIRICIQMKNNAGTEYLRADNVKVSGIAVPSVCHAMGAQTTGSLIEWTIDDSGFDGTYSTIYGEDAYLLICHNGVTSTNYGTGSSLSGSVVLSPGDKYSVTWVDNSTNYAYEHSYSVSMDGIVIASATEADASGSGYTYIMYDDGVLAAHTWTGGGDPGNWDDVNNWDAGTTPTASNNCIIPASPQGPFPDLANPGTYDCADLTIESGGFSTMLQIRDGVELDVSGDFSDAYGLVNVEGKLDIVGSATFTKGVTILGVGEIEVDGATTVSGYTLTIGDGTFDANGSFDASSATIDMNDGNLTLASTVSFGTLDELQGTVTYDGGTSFVSDTYYNLVISSGNEHTASSNVTINNDLTISSGTYRPLSHTTTVSGNTDIDGTLYITTGIFNADGNFDATGGTIDFTSSGELRLSSTVTSLGTLDQTKGTVWYDGGAISLITDSYNNLKISQSGTKTAVGNITVNGDLDAILGSTFDTDGYTTNVIGATSISSNLHIGTGTFDADGSFDANGGTIEFTGAGTLALGSTVTSTGSSLTNTLGTVKYDGTSAQDVVAPSSGGYYNLIIENASTKTATGNIDVDGTLTTEAEASCVFDMSTYDLNVSGDVTIGQAGGLDASDPACIVTFDGTTTLSHAGSQTSSSSASVRDPITYASSDGELLYGLYDYGWSKSLILEADLGSAACTINSIDLWMQSMTNPNYTYNNVTILIKNVGAKSVYASADETYDETGFTTVYTGNLYFDDTQGWQNIDITDYSYSGSGALDIIIKNEDGAWAGGGASFGYGAPGGDRMVTAYADGSFPTGGSAYGLCYMFRFNTTVNVVTDINPTFNELVMNGSDITLSNPVDISSGLTLTSGNIISESDVNGNDSQTYASTNTITLKDGATVSGGSASSHVVGAVRAESSSTTEIEFPTGDGTNYRPAYLTPSTSTATTYTVEYVNAAHSSIAYDGNGYNNTPVGAGIDHVAMGCWWDIEKSSGGSDAYIAITWDANSGVNIPADILLTHWNAGTSMWEDVPVNTATLSDGTGAATASSGRIKSTSPQSDFSPWSPGSSTPDGGPLPVDLISFHTNCSHDIVDVNFSILSQVNNDK
ncbi:MAG: beta strand repeat-containing protein, partial [Parvicellaceae bacterium]